MSHNPFKSREDWDALPTSFKEGWRRFWIVILGTSIVFVGIAASEQVIKPRIQTQTQLDQSQLVKDCPLDFSFSGLYCLIINSELLKLAETFSIVVATWIFILDARARREQAQREDWSLIDGARGSETSGARYSAIKRLHQEQVSLRGLDAEGADLHKIKLPQANLERSNLKKSDLEEAILVGANLQEANLQEANLQRSKLEKADLWLVDLRGANLTEASLINARLSAAKLHRAIMRKANLEGADLRGSRFYDTDFRDANFKDSDVKRAEFVRVKNLTFEQIKLAKNWQSAKFGQDFLPENSEIPRKEMLETHEQPELLQKVNELREIENLLDALNQKRTLSIPEFENYLKTNSFNIPEVRSLSEVVLALEDIQGFKKEELDDLLEDINKGLSKLKQSEDDQ